MKAIKFFAKVLGVLFILVLIATGVYLLFITFAGSSYKEVADAYDRKFSSWDGDAFGVLPDGNEFYAHAGDYLIKLSSPNTSWIDEVIDETSDSEQKLLAGKYMYLDSRKYLSDVSKKNVLMLATTLYESEDLNQADSEVLKSNLITTLNACSINPVWYEIRSFFRVNF